MPRFRLIPVLSSLAIVLASYAVYALVIVGLIEPEAGSRISREGLGGMELGTGQLASLAEHFPEDAWERKVPKILESKSVMLLFGDYTMRGEQEVELHPCTLIFTPEDPKITAAQRNHRAVILQAPEGAVMKFDRPLDLTQAKIGRLVDGRLVGPVVIRSKGKLPGEEDDLRVETRDVVLTEKLVSTPAPVRFQWGPNRGSGRDLAIELLPSDKAPEHGPNVAGIKSMELRRIDKIHLQFDNQDVARPGVLPTGPAPVAADKPDKDSSALPVEITCRGPFRFDLDAKTAAFRDEVDIWRIHPKGPSDHISCDVFTVHLAPKKKPKPVAGAKPSDAKGPGPLDLEPERIEATGNPVVVHAPSESVQARGQRLEYSLRDGRILLDGGREVVLIQGANEIHAPSLQYRPGIEGRLGQAQAAGPGWLVGHSPDKPEDRLEARWNDELQIRPHQQNQVISLTGGASLQFRGVGQLEADEIHFYLNEKPGPQKDNRPQIEPDRMLARNNVRIHHPQLDAAVDELGVWFKNLPPAPSPAGEQSPGKVGAEGARPAAGSWSLRQTTTGQTRKLQLTAVRRPGDPASAPRPQIPVFQSPWQRFLPRPRDPAAAPATPPPSGGSAPATPPGQGLPAGGPSPEARQRFDVTGRRLWAQMLMRGRKAELSELTIDGNVRLVEKQTAKPDERPLVVSGDRIHVIDANTAYAAVAVTGQLAHFEGRGLALNGSNINLNRGTNRLWIDGSGWMELPMDRDPQGRPTGTPGTMQIHWQDRMNFDGRTVRFEESVVGTSQLQHLRTETLEVTLSEPIRFADTKTNARPDVQRIVCRGGAYMENRTLDERGQASLERIQVGQLDLDLGTGQLVAAGPGWVRTVRRGTGQLLEGRSGALTAMHTTRKPTNPQSPDDDSLVYVGVDFQRSLEGNLRRREMTFHGNVRTVYGPADSWDTQLDPDEPEMLGTNGAVLSCDQLLVAEMALPNRSQRAMELVATGNTLIEAGSYTARSSRLSYTEAKDLLILEGDGRVDAELFRQERIGGEMSRFAARKILFWPSTNRLSIDSGSLMEVHSSSQRPTAPRAPLR